MSRWGPSADSHRVPLAVTDTVHNTSSSSSAPAAEVLASTRTRTRRDRPTKQRTATHIFVGSDSEGSFQGTRATSGARVGQANLRLRGPVGKLASEIAKACHDTGRPTGRARALVRVGVRRCCVDRAQTGGGVAFGHKSFIPLYLQVAFQSPGLLMLLNGHGGAIIARQS